MMLYKMQDQHSFQNDTIDAKNLLSSSGLLGPDTF